MREITLLNVNMGYIITIINKSISLNQKDVVANNYLKHIIAYMANVDIVRHQRSLRSKTSLNIISNNILSPNNINLTSLIPMLNKL